MRATYDYLCTNQLCPASEKTEERIVDKSERDNQMCSICQAAATRQMSFTGKHSSWSNWYSPL